MHIAIISDLETQGGAAVAANRLTCGLCDLGHRVSRLVWRPTGGRHSWETHRLPGLWPLPLRMRALRRLVPQSGKEILNRKMIQSRICEVLADLRPDVVNIHNFHSTAGQDGWSADLAATCLKFAPTVWTLHDMWSFTGRCAYSYDCRKFITGCDSTCPTPEEYPALAPDRIKPAWELRRRVFAGNSGLVAVTPSQWLATEARAGLWAGHHVQVIPNGLPLQSFKPCDRAQARAQLGIDAQGPVLLMVADNLTERRKGGQILIEALGQLSTQRLTLLTLGAGRFELPGTGVRVHPLGFKSQPEELAVAYSAADALVHPAPVDNLPNVVVESIACGTPVIGFPIGGMVDMVRPGQTGWLAAEVSSQSLSQAIQGALDDIAQGVDLRPSCREIAQQEYDQGIQAKRYLDLFKKIEVI